MKKRTISNENEIQSISLKNLFLVLASFRVLNALMVRTQFDPDEYWQTLEPAYCAVLSRSSEECALTWEWTRQASEADIEEYATSLNQSSSLSLVNTISTFAWHAMHGPIRSYIGVIPTILFYCFLRILQNAPFQFLSDNAMSFLVRKGPALFHSIIFAAPTDLCVYYIAKMAYSCEVTARYALLASITSWFNGYALVRTYANSIECAMCIMSFSLICSVIFEQNQSKVRRKQNIFLPIVAMFVGGLSVSLRFSAISFWIPVGLLFCYQSESRVFHFVISLMSAVLGLITSLVVEWIMYPDTFTFVFPSLGSFHFNVLLANSSLYGTHPVYWYMAIGLPTISGILFPFFVSAIKDCVMFRRREPTHKAAICRRNTRRICVIIVFYIFTHSFSSHKEFRFILPVLPFVCILSGNYMKAISGCINSGSWFSMKKKIIMLLFVTNIPHLLFLSLIHQRASISVTEFITNTVNNNWNRIRSDQSSFSVHFLMGCHSVPAYSHLYVPNVTAQALMLDCSPTCRKDPSVECESDMLYRDPEKVLRVLYVDFDENQDISLNDKSTCQGAPDFLVIDSSLVNRLKYWTELMGMIEIARFRHSIESIEFHSSKTFPFHINFSEMVVFTSSIKTTISEKLI